MKRWYLSLVLLFSFPAFSSDLMPPEAQSIDLYQPRDKAYICPNLTSGEYANGATLKNADAEQWKVKLDKTIKISRLDNFSWVKLYLSRDLDKKGYTFTCSGEHGGNKVSVSLEVKTSASCFTVPDFQYPQFFCH